MCTKFYWQIIITLCVLLSGIYAAASTLEIGSTTYTLTLLPFSNFSNASAVLGPFPTGINDQDVTVGYSRLKNGATIGPGGLFAGPHFDQLTIGKINNAGDFVASLVVGEFQPSVGIHCNVSSTCSIPPPTRTSVGYAGINNVGQITGIIDPGTGLADVRGFLSTNGSVTLFKASNFTDPHAVNDLGEVVGDHFLYRNGTVTPLAGNAVDINNVGQILFDNGIQDTNGLFTPISIPGATDTHLTAINNLGHIAGWYGDATGDHAFIIGPVPEPSTWILLGSGLVALLLLERRFAL